MAARHALLLAGSLWEAIRFFVVLSLLAQLYYAAGAASPQIVPWLLIGGSGNILMAAGGIMISLFPIRYAELIGFLRLGKVLSLFSFLLLGASGAIGFSASEVALRLGPLTLNKGSVLLGILFFDLAFLAVLLAWRVGKPPA